MEYTGDCNRHRTIFNCFFSGNQSIFYFKTTGKKVAVTQNILYCFDENYNIQALASMISLLDKVSEPINIYIIHKNKKTFIEKSKKVESHPNIKSLNVYDFENKISNFPNISKSHVSEATYYRLFIEDVIPKSVKNLLYLDLALFS